MLIEILITTALIGTAGYILYKKIKEKAAGKCDCSSCSSHCPMRNTETTEMNKH